MLGAGEVRILEICLIFGHLIRHQRTLNHASAHHFEALLGALPEFGWMWVHGVNALGKLVVPNPEKGVSLWKSWPGGKRR